MISTGAKIHSTKSLNPNQNPQKMEIQMKKQILKCKNAKHLFTPHKPGAGVTYSDSRFGRGYDIGTCTTSRGRCIITWGLNASHDELLPDVTYVQVGPNFEAILEER
jgi:hypothetical protein